MRAQHVSQKQYVGTLTGGWRITIPSKLRKAHGWEEGSNLIATVSGTDLLLVSPDDYKLSDGLPVSCYLGAGGKLVIPSALRQTLKWEAGRKLAVTAVSKGLKVAECCDIIQCRSCGSTDMVKEVIPGLSLCAKCWSDYVAAVRKRRPGRIT